MGQILKRGRKTLWLLLAMLGVCTPGMGAQTPGPRTCEKIALAGQVNTEQEWKAAIGEGWVFRLLPIPNDKIPAGEGGWDLAVDRERPAGFPDALMLATPPYHFANQREVATTFGLRAQDAIGWNPRKFRFMTNLAVFHEAQRLFLVLNRNGAFGAIPKWPTDKRKKRALERTMRRFVKLARESSPGEFRILDAHITPGTGEVEPYAANWALHSNDTPHTDEPPAGGETTPLGSLQSMRFTATLWLPHGWKAPRGVEMVKAPCAQ